MNKESGNYNVGMADPMRFYNRMREVPSSATKPITDQNSKLFGLTNINPQWRIQVMTEAFGPIGEGWKVEVAEIQHIPFESQMGLTVYCRIRINLFVRINGEMSEAIPGIGGSILYQNGLLDDDAEKKAYTDAFSVAAKYLGVGADVYFGNNGGADQDKYGICDTQCPNGQPQCNGELPFDSGTFPMPVQQGGYNAPMQQSPAQASNWPSADRNSMGAPVQQGDSSYALIVPFGRFKGKTLGEVNVLARWQIEKWYQDPAIQQNKPQLWNACKAIIGQ